jgi:hypothetical protein
MRKASHKLTISNHKEQIGNQDQDSFTVINGVCLDGIELHCSKIEISADSPSGIKVGIELLRTEIEWVDSNDR